jgi:hypothetical protein
MRAYGLWCQARPGFRGERGFPDISSHVLLLLLLQLQLLLLATAAAAAASVFVLLLKLVL